MHRARRCDVFGGKMAEAKCEDDEMQTWDWIHTKLKCFALLKNLNTAFVVSSHA